MNQDQFLERLWVAVIDRDEPVELAADGNKARPTPKLSQRDLRQVARCARYDAVFDWCMAFDEAGLTPAKWLESKQRSRWKALADAGPGEPVPSSPKRRPPAGAPFAEAYDAMERLSAAGGTKAEIGGVMDRARRDTLERILAALREQAFGPDDLSGLHESILSADPSGMEARPGSWPRPNKAAAKKPTKAAASAKSAAPGPILKLRHSHVLAFSPDGSRIVAAKGGVITEIASGKTLATCGLLANTGDVAWSPDGRWIAGQSTSGKIALFDAVTGVRKRVLEMSGEGPAATFSSDGARVYAGDWSGHLFAWDAATGRELKRIALPDAMIRSIDWARDREGLDVIASYRPAPKVFVALSAELDETERRIEIPDRTSDIVWEADGGQHGLIVGYGFIAHIDRATGAITERGEIPRGASAGHLACSPDGHWYAVTHGDGFRIGSAADLSQGTELKRKYVGGRAAFSRDSKRVAFSTSKEGEVWEIDQLVRA